MFSQCHSGCWLTQWLCLVFLCFVSPQSINHATESCIFFENIRSLALNFERINSYRMNCVKCAFAYACFWNTWGFFFSLCLIKMFVNRRCFYVMCHAMCAWGIFFSQTRLQNFIWDSKEMESFQSKAISEDFAVRETDSGLSCLLYWNSNCCTRKLDWPRASLRERGHC